MTPERWQQIKSLLHAALERDPAARAAFLAAACAGDETLRPDVESLINAHEQAGDFIESPAFELMADSLGDKTDSLAGQSLGHYQIISQLGAGGMGEVYLAEDTRLGRKIALKILTTHFIRDPDRLRRFQQEARAASALNHPNILTIHEIGKIDSRHFMVTEFIEGETLRQVTESKGGHYSPWSPDGSTIAYSTHVPRNDCVIVQPDKSWNGQQLTYLPPLSDATTSFEAWAWSPDCKKLAGIKHLPNCLHSGIGVYDPASGNYDWFTDFGDWPVWLNDNRRMLFVSQGKIFCLTLLAGNFSPS